ncbi:Ldh family oxidoreductase [Desertibaculum subflavum]|uniref:Ldh family oxidoreductase n=1 Tax=Desertibaculum subflavum TaxID=2268458 RepID=UPI000E676467
MPRYAAADLVLFAASLLEKSGVTRRIAITVAEVLVEGDLLGHDTHGLAQLPAYLDELAGGRMAKGGEPVVLSDRGPAVAWDGQRLPGPYLVRQAVDLACERAPLHGLCGISIRRSHHIACLAAYLKRVTDRGLVMLLFSADPNQGSVAPFGGTRALYTPNPIAAAWPTDGAPVMIDISASITTNAMTARRAREGVRFPAPWLLDAAGHPTDDPNALFTNPPGTILPLGGMEAGHKGYGLALLVEAMANGLAGQGRARAQDKWGANVFVLVFDPEAFGGRDAFTAEAGWLATQIRVNPPRPDVEAVRLPGERGLARRAAALREGVPLHASILPALAPWAEKLGAALPKSH